MLETGFFQGQIRHRRYRPKPHEFTYDMYWTLLDLDSLETDFSKNKFWSNEKWNLISFKRKDFHSVEDLNTKDSITKTIEEKTGENFLGKIFLLSHLRYLGFNFNSVSFYFCIDESGMQFIVSEITNTPWGERHPYVLKCDSESENKFIFNFKKAFHISPFIQMEMDYRWSFIFEEDTLRIHMVVLQENTNNKIFDATFTAEFIPFTESNMTSTVLKEPFQPLKMVAGIYWQAFRLWLKKIPFIEHPKYRKKNNQLSNEE